jgi:ribonucleotide monophosphatase NagD (HAD superfamily)
VVPRFPYRGWLLDLDGTVYLGDRIDTDIVMGRRLGLGTVLVLSGVTRADDPRIAAVAPDHVVRSIRDLVE